MNILITGATGLIGKELGKCLASLGHKIFVVSRNARKAKEALPFPCEVIEGDLSIGQIDDVRLNKIEAVFNLMGEPVVNKRWNTEVKQKIYDSRVVGTRHLIASLREKNSDIKVFISGSAIGFYGDRSDKICTENETAGNDFLSQVTQDWEKEALKAPGRICLIRTGIVLSSSGGALDQMLFPFKAGVGGVLASGMQWMSWIHVSDLVNLLIFALENENIMGPINGVAPVPVRNKDFSKSLATSLGKKLAIPVPKLALYAIFGDASATILSSIRCESKATELGFKFKYQDVDKALDEICSPFRTGEEIFYSEQFIPLAPEKIFEYFKDPYNLERITPPSLQFNIQAISTDEIQQGTTIDYKLKIHGVPAKWKTLIDEWQPPYKFVDTALKGPYKVWHHTHEFKPFCGGTLMVDRVRYKLPLGYFGWLTTGAFVRRDVENIFKFRRQVISDKYLQNP